jgi:cyclic beta-1,2-glucan synthetase
MSAPLPLLRAVPAALPDEILAGEALLRAEVFSRQQLAQHARDLAAWHRVGPDGHGNPLLVRLEENATVLRVVLARLRQTTGTVPAGEWLLDNHHLIAEEVATVRRHLPRKYSQELPILQIGEPEGAPRVYALALELISHADGRVDQDSLRDFAAAYQEVPPVTLGNLWGLRIMLRLALL